MMHWLPPLLPPPDTDVIRDTVLEKQQRAPLLEDACEAVEGLTHRRNGAERERAHNGVDTRVAERDTFAGQGQELNLQTRAALSLGQASHAWIRLERVQPLDLGYVVVRKVDS
jgi:hypothetical protein